MTTLSINYADTNNPTALACQYSGQHRPQRAFIALNLDDGTMWADYDGEIGNGVPESVWHGVVRRYLFPADTIPTTDAANRIMDEIAPLAQTVLDNSSTSYNNNGNYVGGVNDAGREAEEGIEQELGSGLDESESECVGIIDAGDWWYTLTDDELANMDEMSITADTTDEQIAALAPLYLKDMEQSMGAVVCDDLEDYLLSRRDDMREQVAAQ